jgi:two-component system sensor histidine kinase DesK
VVLVAALVSYSGIYGWYCLQGHRVRDTRAQAATVALLTLLAVALDLLSGEAANNYFLIPVLIAGFSLRPRAAFIAFAVVAAVSVLDVVLLTRLPLEQVIFAAVLVLPAVALFGGSGLGLRYLLTTLADLRAARAEIAQHATEQERSRIARDLHDLLGHSLSLITLKGELATRLLPEGSPGVDEVRDMLGLSRQALQQVREAVSGYRKPTLATEFTAAKVALQAAGVEIEIKQDIGAVDRETEAVLGWVIREATTNVIRHSGAKHCTFALTGDNRQVCIEVTNDGWRVPQTPAGNGLRGLDERLFALGGGLDASALSGAGFRLVATVPVQPNLNAGALESEVIA